MAAGDNSNLGVTALYTSQVWRRSGLQYAELYDSWQARWLYQCTTAIYRFARWLRPAMAPIDVALLHRHSMIDHLLNAAEAPQVIELAAGLSSRGARATDAGAVRYTEVDLPSVIEAKRKLLGRSATGQQIADRADLRFVLGDATRLDFEPYLDPRQPAFVIAEGLHMYLDADSQKRMWTNIATALARGKGGTFVFDHLRRAETAQPNRVSRGVLAAMKSWQEKIGFSRDLRTAADVATDLTAAGFDRVEEISSPEVAKAWNLPANDVATDIVLMVATVDDRSASSAAKAAQ